MNPSKSNRSKFVILLGTLTLAGACQKNGEAPEPKIEPMPAAQLPPIPADAEAAGAETEGPTEPMAPASRLSSVAEAIAEARCAREQRCENIGVNKPHATMQECTMNVRNTWRDELRTRECAGGAVNRENLDACLVEVRNDDCRNPFGTLGRVAACTPEQICAG